ncbi:MAG: mechanosensitive ion channel [Actinomycetota bacterium]|nr:mechanosensitive ion channel [Actinomycetota bacterium]
MLAKQPLWVQRLDELHLLTAATVALSVLVAILLTFIVRRIIKRILRRVLELPGSDRGRAEARQRSLATALRGALVGVIWSLTLIVIIGEAGVNIGAFVATATVVGGAVAFGAQTLVRDVIAGLFILADDQYGVGDDVDLGVASGTVERLTLRSVRLRDGAGAVWYVQHGGVARVGNMTKASATRFDLEVARHTSLADLDAAVEALCAALAATPAAAHLLAAPPTPAGIASIADDRLVYRVNVPVRPGAHDELGAIWRRLVVGAFEAGRLVPPSPNTNAVPRGNPGAPSVTEPA